MEAYILLLLFFLGLPLAIYLVLSDPNKSAQSTEQVHKHNQQKTEEKPGAASRTAAYAVIAALLAFFCVLTILIQRGRT